MKKCVFLVLCTFVVLLSNAQVSRKYLAGAVPEVDGKIVFSSTVKASSLKKDQLFKLLFDWANSNYNTGSNRILYSDSVSGDIACIGSKELIFKSSALALDGATLNYQLILNINDGVCEAKVRNLKYDYASDKLSLYPAEKLIADKVALNGNKLYRHYDKFRMHTIDSIGALFNSIDVYLNGTKGITGVATTITTPLPINTKDILNDVLVEETPEEFDANSQFRGYKKITPDKIPLNIVKLLNNWSLIVSGRDDSLNVMTASWGGLGMLWEKPIVFSFINPTRYSIQTMDMGNVYTISFYPEEYKDKLSYCGSVSGKDVDKIKMSGLTPIEMPSGGKSFSEAWLILECRKIVAEPISAESVYDKELAQEWSKKGYHKMYIGEIIGVWIK